MLTASRSEKHNSDASSSGTHQDTGGGATIDVAQTPRPPLMLEQTAMTRILPWQILEQCCEHGNLRCCHCADVWTVDVGWLWVSTEELSMCTWYQTYYWSLEGFVCSSFSFENRLKMKFCLHIIDPCKNEKLKFKPCSNTHEWKLSVKTKYITLKKLKGEASTKPNEKTSDISCYKV